MTAGADGIGIVYDPGEGNNPPSDTTLYKDNSLVNAGYAAQPPNDNKVFDHWVIQHWNGTADVDSDNTVLAGQVFNIQKSDAKITDANTGAVVDPENVVATGFIAVLFIMCTMAIQHPFNACLGPNEDQVRTLKCACSTAFLSMTIVGLLSAATGGIGWFVVLVIGLIGWIVSFRAFVTASINDAASTKWAGLWPKVEQ